MRHDVGPVFVEIGCVPGGVPDRVKQKRAKVSWGDTSDLDKYLDKKKV